MDLLPLVGPGKAPVRVLTVAGTDSGGGAGMQADSRTMALCGVHALVAVTAVTVQNSVGVAGFHEIPVDIVTGQIRGVVTDIGASAVKTGMLASAEIIAGVAGVCQEHGIGRGGEIPLVVDPVAASMHGDALLRADAVAALRETLVPLATVVTPNLDEVRLLTDIEVRDDVSARRAAEELHALGAEWSVVKGGHLRTASTSTDLLFDGRRFREFPAERLSTRHDHGGGDTLAAALACALAHEYPVPDAFAFAKQWTHRCLAAAYPLGHGSGPVSPLWRLT